MHRRTLIAVLFTCSIGVPAYSQTAQTGSIVGHVRELMRALPGVTVEARSPALPGVRSDVTDGDGAFRFPLLPPGQYTVSTIRGQRETITQNDITVTLARTVTVDLTFLPTASEAITVSAKPSSIDVTSTITGAAITAEGMRSLPFDRNYVSVAQIAPGVRRDDFGTTFYGSTSLENEYVVNGINTTDVYIGLENKRVNLDFIQEVDVMSGGLPAEYGRITGGVVNAVTKSGSNESRGGLFGYTAGGSLESAPKYLGRLSERITTYSDVAQQFDYGANLGGYVIKDRLWFFGAYDRVSERDVQKPISAGGPPARSAHVISDLSAAKLTVSLASNQLLNLSVFGDPNLTGDPQLSMTAHGGNDLVADYSAVFGQRWNVTALVGRNAENDVTTGPATQIPLVLDFSQPPGTAGTGVGQYLNQEGRRDMAKLDASAFAAGHHTVKFGIDEERLGAHDRLFLSGGDEITKLCSADLVNNRCPSNAIYYTHRAFINDLSPTFDVNDPTTFARNAVNPMPIDYVIHNASAYVQDAWSLPNITMNVGMRYEQQILDNARNQRFLRLGNLSPRVGIAWDAAKDGRSKVYGFYGRFYESLTLELAQEAGSNGIALDVANLDPKPGDLIPDPRAPAFGPPYGQYQTNGLSADLPVDPHLKGQYMDEYLVGYDREFRHGLVIGTKGIYRSVGRIIEDTYRDGYGYILVNPGRGIGSTIEMISGEIVPAPKPVRRDAGAELHATLRTPTTEVFASYLWSRLYGNYEGLYQQSAGFVTPNIDPVYDRGDFMVNSYGPLFSDRTHQTKLYGSHRFASLNVGFAMHWYSGAPLTAMNCASRCFITARGALGRGPSDYEADVHVGYPLHVRNGRVELVADVFNVLNRQAPTELDRRFNYFYAGPCGGIPDGLCNGHGALKNKPGTTEPVGQLPDPRATAPNPHFMKPDAFTGQRSIRLGARVSL